MTIRVGIIGCGLMARAHLPGYQAAGDRAQIVMCCDDHEDAAQTLAAKIGASQAITPAVTTRWQDVIDNSTVDAVDICAPHFLHAPIVLAAASAGKHILLEKPMAMSLDDAR